MHKIEELAMSVANNVACYTLLERNIDKRVLFYDRVVTAKHNLPDVAAIQLLAIFEPFDHFVDEFGSDAEFVVREGFQTGTGVVGIDRTTTFLNDFSTAVNG